MVVRVPADRVPLVELAADDVGPLVDHVAEHEEGRRGVVAVQDVEDLVGVGARPVVEGQRHLALARPALVDEARVAAGRGRAPRPGGRGSRGCARAPSVSARCPRWARRPRCSSLRSARSAGRRRPGARPTRLRRPTGGGSRRGGAAARGGAGRGQALAHRRPSGSPRYRHAPGARAPARTLGRACPATKRSRARPSPRPNGPCRAAVCAAPCASSSRRRSGARTTATARAVARRPAAPRWRRAGCRATAFACSPAPS